MNSAEFSKIIEDLVEEKKDLSYMDAVVYYCEKKDIDTSTVSKLLTKNLKAKIEVEARELNYLPRRGKLPI
jgi:hypothetical protein